MRTAITVVWSCDEAHLDVERDVLVEVARRVVRLGAEDRADLEDALEDADHDLLVELRALRQVGRPAEVVDGEDVGPALGGRGDELRRLDLDEAQRRAAWRGSRRSSAAATEQSARWRGWRSASGAWSRMVGSCAAIVGRKRSNGGGSAAAEITSTVGSWTSTPPGACGCATTAPSTASTDSRWSAAKPSDRRVLDDDLGQSLGVAQDQETDIC